MSGDPIGFRAGDQNLYRYARNNPLNIIDPFGLQAATKPGEGPGGLPDLLLDPFESTEETRNFHVARRELRIYSNNSRAKLPKETLKGLS